MILKICGITNQEDATAAIEAGATAVGFNFYARSPRYIAPERAAEIVTAEGVRRVGVFVNEKRERVEEIARAARLDRMPPAKRVEMSLDPAGRSACATSGKPCEWATRSTSRSTGIARRKPCYSMDRRLGCTAARGKASTGGWCARAIDRSCWPEGSTPPMSPPQSKW